MIQIIKANLVSNMSNYKYLSDNFIYFYASNKFVLFLFNLLLFVLSHDFHLNCYYFLCHVS